MNTIHDYDENTFHEHLHLLSFEDKIQLCRGRKISDRSNNIISNIERTQMCPSIGNRTRTSYVWL